MSNLHPPMQLLEAQGQVDSLASRCEATRQSNTERCVENKQSLAGKTRLGKAAVIRQRKLFGYGLIPLQFAIPAKA
ncbi:hypothetical protein DTW90_20255 [Neorhizobium sp. P12A]|nr:hypothetical protein DTW90_20255 [Neorhizobium sp. P12A]